MRGSKPHVCLLELSNPGMTVPQVSWFLSPVELLFVPLFMCFMEIDQNLHNPFILSQSINSRWPRISLQRYPTLSRETLLHWWSVPDSFGRYESSRVPVRSYLLVVHLNRTNSLCVLRWTRHERLDCTLSPLRPTSVDWRRPIQNQERRTDNTFVELPGNGGCLRKIPDLRTLEGFNYTTSKLGVTLP